MRRTARGDRTEVLTTSSRRKFFGGDTPKECHDTTRSGLQTPPDRPLSLHRVDRTMGWSAEEFMTMVAESPTALAEQTGAMLVWPPAVPAQDMFAELLKTIAKVLDVRDVFSQVSAIANKLLPHDALTLTFIDEQGRFVEQAASTDDLRGMPRLIEPDAPGGSDIIIEDLLGASQRADEQDKRERLVAAGYRSLLRIVTRARAQAIALTFLSRQPHAFSQQDVAMARRMADLVALAVSHEQLAEAARELAEARARIERVEARAQVLAPHADVRTHPAIVGQSAPWLDALKRATQVAATEATVLVTGESGTGKEVVARFIHRASARRKGPFVALNCAALPEQLLESELFGYERGAFTGAQQQKPGQIELASGGVLFLDEVSEMSPPAQAKFLRVLQEREFQRLGGTRTLKANIRIIAATNRDLRDAVVRGTFREDLFYRLLVFDIWIAPLRERPDDILPLTDAYLQEIGMSNGRAPATLTSAAREDLLSYDWPGNVRELRNALDRATILSEGGHIRSEHLVLRGVSRRSEQPTADLSTVERHLITKVLGEERWNKAKSARRLGLSRTQLYYRLRKYGLEKNFN
jgi:two-component system response regulator AtoC